MPSAIASITALIGSILTESIINRESGELSQMLIFYNCPKSGSLYEPICQQLLPIDAKWQHSLAQATWSTKNLPEIIADNTTSLLRTLIREYIFISLFKACAESLASENTSRLAAMQRAEKNIDELLENLKQTSHRGFKSSGFNLEDTNLTDCDRLQNLLCVMAIAYCIAYKIGEITIETKPLIIKSQGYPPKSIFRIGLDEIKNAIANITRKYNYIKTLVCRVISIALSGLSLKEKIVR